MRAVELRVLVPQEGDRAATAPALSMESAASTSSIALAAFCTLVSTGCGVGEDAGAGDTPVMMGDAITGREWWAIRAAAL